MIDLNITSEQISSFGQLLDKVEVQHLSRHEYCRRYFEHIRNHKSYYLKIYASILNEALQISKFTIENIVLLDYGCGNGVLGLFAKYCGFGKVIFCDLDSYFIKATDNLSKQLNIVPDDLLVGDIVSVKWHFFDRGINTIVGSDVIEHIYDLNAFFKTLSSMSYTMVTVFSTAANPENPLLVRKLRKMQYRDEWRGLSPEEAALTGEPPHASFRSIRESLIRRSIPTAPDQLVSRLTDITKGMDRNHLLTYLEIFQVNGRMPHKMPDAYNTCNPITSSWTERLLSLDEYTELYKTYQFKVSFKPGFYDVDKAGRRKWVTQSLNRLIPIFGMKIAPFILLSGKYVGA